MLSPFQLITLLKPHYGNDGLDMTITFHQLCLWVPDATREELVSVLVDLPAVNIAESASGSIIIPKHHFDN